MELFWAFIYGIIQGVTEFLPISSSGHLALLPFFFKFEDPGVFFDLMMHFGTALAVISYFWRDIFEMTHNLFRVLKGEINNPKTYFVQNFCIATIASVLCILILKKFALDMGRNAWVIGVNLIFFGILMALADRNKDINANFEVKRDWKRSLLIGVAQSFAIFPGVSRSGITLTAARFSGVGRENAGRFSFLMSLPIILASIAYKTPAILSGEAIHASWAMTTIGIGISFVVGLATIHFFLKLVNKYGLVYYTVYRIILGLFVLYFTLR